MDVGQDDMFLKYFSADLSSYSDKTQSKQDNSQKRLNTQIHTS